MKSLLQAFSKVGFFVFALFGMGKTLSAQCTFMIPPPPGHVKVLSSQTLNATGTIYWICEGLTVNIASSPGSVYVLEQNVTLNINNSDGDEVYAKAGCVINNNTIQDIGVTVNPSNVTLNNNSTGTITITSSCTSVIYDYSVSGGGPCIGNTGIGEDKLTDLRLFPNPVVAGKDVFIESADGIDDVKIFDLAGKLIYCIKQKPETFSTEILLPGFYIVEINSDGKVGRSRLMVLGS